jgi:hypothetical protein
MTKYFKILLLFIFVAAPVMDIAFLDPQESADHVNEAYHDAVDHEEDASTDLHCICHVLHHGASDGKIGTLVIHDMSFKTHRIANFAIDGLNPKPGLHPPSTILS